MLNQLADGAAAQAEAGAAEGAAKAKEEALAKARKAACAHECAHLKGTREAAPDQGWIKAAQPSHGPQLSRPACILPVLCAVGSAVTPARKTEARLSHRTAIGLAAPLPCRCPSPYITLRPSYHAGAAALSAVEEAQRPLDEAQYSSSSGVGGSGGGIVASSGGSGGGGAAAAAAVAVAAGRISIAFKVVG